MAKLTLMPQLSIIDGFKGTIDYYVHDGVACARRWPRSPGHTRAPAVMATWPAFTWAATAWNDLSQEVRDAYNRQAAGTNMTGRDIFTKSFMAGSTIILEGI